MLSPLRVVSPLSFAWARKAGFVSFGWPEGDIGEGGVSLGYGFNPPGGSTILEPPPGYPRD